MRLALFIGRLCTFGYISHCQQTAKLNFCQYDRIYEEGYCTKHCIVPWLHNMYNHTVIRTSLENDCILGNVCVHRKSHGVRAEGPVTHQKKSLLQCQKHVSLFARIIHSNHQQIIAIPPLLCLNW